MISHSLITDAMKDQFVAEGYMIFEGVIPEDTMHMLREECAYFIGYKDAQLDRSGETTEGITHRGSRYFISHYYRLSNRLWQFVFSPLMAEIAQAALGPDVYLINEQWVVKGAESGMPFAWHQDSGYVKFRDPATRHRMYLTCWCTLDDVNEENGTVYLLPHSRGGTSHTVFDHVQEGGTNDLVGYTGDDPGIPITVSAGSIVAFSSYNFHRSSRNTTDRMRRVYLTQYSAEPLMSVSGERSCLAVPFVKNGEISYDHENNTAAQYGGVGAPA